MAKSEKMAAVQAVLWMAYTACAIVSYTFMQENWTLTLLISSACILPMSFLKYNLFKENPNAVLNTIWVALTAWVLFLFGLCSYIEPWT